MENTYCVYIHTNEVNEKKYIGITCQKPEKRWANGYGYRKNTHFWNAIQKYGWDNFKHEIFYDNLTEKEAKLYEQWLIYLGNTTNDKYGYNITEGGEGCIGYKHTEETKKLLSELAKKKVGNKNPNYGNHKLAGKNNPNYGKHLSEEARKKISEKSKEKNRGKGNPMYGKRGENNPNWNRGKNVNQIDLNGNIIKVWNNRREAIQKYGNSIAVCLSGKTKTAYGFIWRYIEEVV